MGEGYSFRPFYKDEDLRFYRNKIIRSDREHEKQHTFSLDFYSLSTFRDLLFHTQEHQFTINQIRKFMIKVAVLDDYQNVFSQIVDLTKFESKYDFKKWCQTFLNDTLIKIFSNDIIANSLLPQMHHLIVQTCG